MHGRITYITEDEQYKFKGAILGEDGRTYKFNSGNWVNKNLCLCDLHEEQEVEFELKAPNQYGYVFPKRIRFPGEVLEFRYNRESSQPSHNKGSFSDFVYVKTDSIARVLEQIVENFADSEYAQIPVLYKKIATTFNGLKNEDFIPFESEEPSVLFPAGFTSVSGLPVYIHCIPNRNESVPWYAEDIVVGGEILGRSVFSLVNANWYDLEAAIHEILPNVRENAFEIIRKIEERCFDAESSLVYLDQGCLSNGESADELYVPTGYHEQDGKEIYLLCKKKNGVKGYGWYFCALTYENAPITIFEKKLWLEKWSGLIENAIYEQLADQTLEEQWSFGNRADYGILKNYLRYTFAHQWVNENIEYSSDKQYAAFNTGLPDRNTYKYLYAFFEKTQDNSNQEFHPLYHRPVYTFKEFVVPGRGGNGKILSSNIRPLPNPPQYFEARSATVWELDFNDSNQITIPEYDDTHILIQRCERIPLDFYRYPAVRSAKLSRILDSDKPASDKYKEIREYFKPIVDNAPDNEVTVVYRTLADSLGSVISTAVKKLSWNWRAVVPCFNPERNESCFLLPVSFCDTAKPDRAMVASVDKHDDDYVYTIHTVIPLDWAYLDARLICRPESEWLAADFIDEEEL